MLAFRFAREGLLESQKLTDKNVTQQRLSAGTTIPPDSKENIATAIRSPAEMSNTADSPLRILQIRFAKGEISKEEYEEMRKMFET